MEQSFKLRCFCVIIIIIINRTCNFYFNFIVNVKDLIARKTRNFILPLLFDTEFIFGWIDSEFIGEWIFIIIQALMISRLNASSTTVKRLRWFKLQKFLLLLTYLRLLQLLFIDWIDFLSHQVWFVDLSFHTRNFCRSFAAYLLIKAILLVCLWLRVEIQSNVKCKQWSGILFKWNWNGLIEIQNPKHSKGTELWLHGSVLHWQKKTDCRISHSFSSYSFMLFWLFKLTCSKFKLVKDKAL